MSDTESDFQLSKSSKKENFSKESTSKDQRSKSLVVSKSKKDKVKPTKKEKGGKVIAKQPRKKKESKGKGVLEDSESKDLVFDYMLKQNRPYNLLNVFDNLHGKIKKPLLQNILNELNQEGKLTCKEFGKNKVYFLNQESMNVDKETVEKLGTEFHDLREIQKDLSEQYKKGIDELRKLTSKKTLNEIISDITVKEKTVKELQIKMEKLLDIGSEKVEEEEVLKIQKEEAFLSKELKKRKKLAKECLSMWSEMLEKKVPEVAQMMGVDL